MGVCTRHWPANYKTKRKKGHDIPVDPTLIFDSPASTTPSMARNRKVVVDMKSLTRSPPVVEYSIQVYNNFRIICNYRGNEISIWEIIKSKPSVVKRYSELRKILAKLDDYDLSEKLSMYSDGILQEILNQQENLDAKRFKQLHFLSEQLKLQSCLPKGRKYSASMVRAALEIFLRNRNCYKFLRNVLALPHEKDLIKYFGNLLFGLLILYF